jgi:hypothetical protein
MRLSFPLCLLDRHSPVPDRIRSEWLVNFGVCRHCGRGIQQHTSRSWVAIKPRSVDLAKQHKG